MTDAFSPLHARLAARLGLSHRRAWTGGLLLLLLAALAWAGAPRTAQAQTRGDGSIYSRFGLGELRSFTSAQTEAMGGGGLALRSLNYTSFANPALWSDQELARLALGARYRQVNAENETGETSRLSNGALQAVQFSFPLYTNKLGVGIGFRPYSRTEYRVQSTLQPVPPASPTDTTTAEYQIRYEGEGGLQQISGGLGYRLGEALSLGVRADVIFGILENQRRTVFTDARFNPTALAARTRVAGITGTAGALLSLAGVLRSGDALSAGATFTLPARLSGERVRTLGENLDRDTLAIGGGARFEEEGGLTVPLSAAFGLSYKPDARWTLVADGRYEPWSNAESDFSLPGFDALRDRVRASAGIEFLPAGENLNETFFKRTAYRLGGYYEQSYVNAETVFGGSASSTGIDELAATGGISLPTPLYGTRIDVGFTVGTRGTMDDRLVRDLFYGVSLNVNLGERWFQRRRLR